MWLKHLTKDELGSVDKFNRSMSRLGAVPQIEVPTYRAQTPAELAATRRRRTVLMLSALTVLGSAISIVTGLWLLMAIPATLLLIFFTAAWRAVSNQSRNQSTHTRIKERDSHLIDVAQGKEWDVTPTVLPNRVLGEKGVGSVGQNMVELAAKQVEVRLEETVEQEDIELANEEDERQPNKKTAAG
jgi:hypothetical protein